MNTVVVDASVAAKWVLPERGETLVEEAMQLLADYEAAKIRFIVPDLFWAEMANVLWKSARVGRISRTSAEAALAAVQRIDFSSISAESLIEFAFGIANAFDRTVYDSLYVALALKAKAQFITADRRLANALAAELPVKWLGQIELT